MMTLPRSVPPASMSTHEVARLAEVSYRQLDYWVRVGYIDTGDYRRRPGSGSARRWTPEETAQAVVLARVNQLTRDLEVAARVARLAREHFENRTVEGRSVVVYGNGQVAVVGRSELVAAMLSEPLGLVVHLAGLLAPVQERFALVAS